MTDITSLESTLQNAGLEEPTAPALSAGAAEQFAYIRDFIRYLISENPWEPDLQPFEDALERYSQNIQVDWEGFLAAETTHELMDTILAAELDLTEDFRLGHEGQTTLGDALIDAFVDGAIEWVDIDALNNREYFNPEQTALLQQALAQAAERAFADRQVNTEDQVELLRDGVAVLRRPFQTTDEFLEFQRTFPDMELQVQVLTVGSTPQNMIILSREDVDSARHGLAPITSSLHTHAFESSLSPSDDDKSMAEIRARHNPPHQDFVVSFSDSTGDLQLAIFDASIGEFQIETDQATIAGILQRAGILVGLEDGQTDDSQSKRESPIELQQRVMRESRQRTLNEGATTSELSETMANLLVDYAGLEEPQAWVIAPSAQTIPADQVAAAWTQVGTDPDRFNGDLPERRQLLPNNFRDEALAKLEKALGVFNNKLLVSQDFREFRRHISHLHSAMSGEYGSPYQESIWPGVGVNSGQTVFERLMEEIFHSETAGQAIFDDPYGRIAQIAELIFRRQPFGDYNFRMLYFLANFLLIKTNHTPFWMTEDNIVEFFNSVERVRPEMAYTREDLPADAVIIDWSQPAPDSALAQFLEKYSEPSVVARPDNNATPPSSRNNPAGRVQPGLEADDHRINYMVANHLPRFAVLDEDFVAAENQRRTDANGSTYDRDVWEEDTFRKYARDGQYLVFTAQDDQGIVGSLIIRTARTTLPEVLPGGNRQLSSIGAEIVYLASAPRVSDGTLGEALSQVELDLLDYGLSEIHKRHGWWMPFHGQTYKQVNGVPFIVVREDDIRTRNALIARGFAADPTVLREYFEDPNEDGYIMIPEVLPEPVAGAQPTEEPGLEEGIVSRTVRANIMQLWNQWDQNVDLNDQAQPFQETMRLLADQGFEAIDLHQEGVANVANRNLRIRSRWGEDNTLAMYFRDLFESEQRRDFPMYRLLENFDIHVAPSFEDVQAIYRHGFVSPARALVLWNRNTQQWVVMDQGPGIENLPEMLESGASVAVTGRLAGDRAGAGIGTYEAIRSSSGAEFWSSRGDGLSGVAILPDDVRTYQDSSGTNGRTNLTVGDLSDAGRAGTLVLFNAPNLPQPDALPQIPISWEQSLVKTLVYSSLQNDATAHAPLGERISLGRFELNGQERRGLIRDISDLLRQIDEVLNPSDRSEWTAPSLAERFINPFLDHSLDLDPTAQATASIEISLAQHATPLTESTWVLEIHYSTQSDAAWTLSIDAIFSQRETPYSLNFREMAIHTGNADAVIIARLQDTAGPQQVWLANHESAPQPFTANDQLNEAPTQIVVRIPFMPTRGSLSDAAEAIQDDGFDDDALARLWNTPGTEEIGLEAAPAVEAIAPVDDALTNTMSIFMNSAPEIPPAVLVSSTSPMVGAFAALNDQVYAFDGTEPTDVVAQLVVDNVQVVHHFDTGLEDGGVLRNLLAFAGIEVVDMPAAGTPVASLIQQILQFFGVSQAVLDTYLPAFMNDLESLATAA